MKYFKKIIRLNRCVLTDFSKFQDDRKKFVECQGRM